ncbi:LysR substrate-binding domain-containing protein [Colwellia echini]|uniref:LysR family transcriptional regulator n=1 Tax=Colwellia echini TaxID=1982103 RepID=A0ABY3MVX0_9GAMM|nr:LysR substrate-binding domain-containing protein [Colwellia echini]TYK65232.1 LysR family transcriptional regulator [Colwellia echini]
MNTPPLSIEALLVLDAIEHRGSFAAAAEQLNKVPSALSYIVQKLEEQLNVTIFVRQGRRSVLTPAGKHLLIEGRKVLLALNALSEQTQTIANGWEPKIRIACDSIIDIKPIFTGIQRFLTEHENIEIDVREEVMNGTWEALIEDKVDLVIGAPAPIPVQKGIRAIKISDFDSVLVVSKSYQFASQLLTSSSKEMSKPPSKQSSKQSSNQSSKESIKARTSISTTELTKYRSVVVHDSAKNEIPWSVNVIDGKQRFYVSSIGQKIDAIIAGIGIGFLPKYLAQQYIMSGQLTEIALTENKVRQDLFMAWKITNKGKGLNKLTAILLGEK